MSLTRNQMSIQKAIVVDDLRFNHTFGKQRQTTKTVGHKNTTKKSSGIVVSNAEEFNSIMKMQKLKDQAAKRTFVRNRNTEKRAQNVLLFQSRRVKDSNKLLSVEVFNEEEEHNGTFIYKHPCNIKNSSECEECFYGSTPTYN
jgi:hypothetical protein